eukprot:403334040
MESLAQKIEDISLQQNSQQTVEEEVKASADWGQFNFKAGSQNAEAKVIANANHGDVEQKQQKPYKSKKQSKFDKLQEEVDEEVRDKWMLEQNTLKQQLIEDEDKFSWVIDPSNYSNSTLRYIAAIDISYSKTDDRKAVAALIVCQYPTMKILYEDFEKETADYPYIPGFLAFKEVPVYSILFDRLKAKEPDLWPDVLLVDGNGILHTRGFGCASHVGVLQNLPSIGVGKTVFAVDGLTQLGVKDLCDQTLLKGGDLVNLVGKSGKVWGAALRSTSDSKNPIIISVGHRITLQTAIDVVKACIKKVRIPEPIRQADLKSRSLVKKFYDSDNGVEQKEGWKNKGHKGKYDHHKDKKDQVQ